MAPLDRVPSPAPATPALLIARDDLLGERLGAYRIEQLLGQGASSRVYLGVHVALGKKVAIKVLSPALTTDAESIARLVCEATIIGAIRHPNIVDILDVVETTEPRRVALVMEHVQGVTLRALRGQRLAYGTALAIIRQVIDGLQVAHAAGVIHRDLKPDNILLTLDPRVATPTDQLSAVLTPRNVCVKIIDFGTAKYMTSAPLTKVGAMLGTPAYMAPEQIVHHPAPSPATDVFAVGELLYELLSGTRAYPAGEVMNVLRAKLRGDRPALALPPVPGRALLLELIHRCLASRPSARPSLDEMLSTLAIAEQQPSAFVPRFVSARSPAPHVAPRPTFVPRDLEETEECEPVTSHL